MDYIKRTLEQKILEINEDYSCLLLIGPRQVGKTTMLEHLMEGTNRQKVTLDDTENRRLAKTDPALFLELHPAPVLIDEVQYAPELFSYIKINVDNGAAPGSYWLTGSQAFQLTEIRIPMRLTWLSKRTVNSILWKSKRARIRELSLHQPLRCWIRGLFQEGPALSCVCARNFPR